MTPCDYPPSPRIILRVQGIILVLEVIHASFIERCRRFFFTMTFERYYAHLCLFCSIGSIHRLLRSCHIAAADRYYCIGRRCIFCLVVSRVTEIASEKRPLLSRYSLPPFLVGPLLSRRHSRASIVY